MSELLNITRLEEILTRLGFHRTKEYVGFPDSPWGGWSINNIKPRGGTNVITMAKTIPMISSSIQNLQFIENTHYPTSPNLGRYSTLTLVLDRQDRLKQDQINPNME